MWLAQEVLGRISAPPINDLIVGARASASATELVSCVNSLITEYESYDTEWTVYTPVVGVVSSIDGVTLGQVTVLLLDENLTNEMVLAGERLIDARDPSLGPSMGLAEEIRQHAASMTGKTWSRFRVVAEPTRAAEKALEETRTAVDLLRYTALALFGTKEPPMISIEGEVPACTVSSYISHSSDWLHAVLSSQLRGPISTISLTPDTLARMRQIRAFAISDMLREGRALTDFETAIVRGVHWLGNASVQLERSNVLLNLTTVLETFLAPDSGDRISRTIAEGVALVLADGWEQRKRLRDKVRKLYDKRSVLSHGGLRKYWLAMSWS